MKSLNRIATYLRITVVIIICGLLFIIAIEVLGLKNDGVNYQVFQMELPLIEKKTGSKIVTIKGRSIDNSELPILYRASSDLKSIFVPRKVLDMRQKERVEEYTVRSGHSSIIISVYLTGDKIYMVLLMASHESDDVLVKKWHDALSDKINGLTIKLAASTNSTQGAKEK